MAISATTAFPFTKWDQHKDWKELCPAEGGKEKLEVREVMRTKQHLVVSVRGKTRQEVVARNLKAILCDNQNRFGLHGAGIEHYSGAIPLYDDKNEVVGYMQDFRFTNGL